VGDLHETLDGLYRAQSRVVLATLIRLLGDFDLAEEALQEAFTAAAEQWPREGIPVRPVPWLVSTGRFKAIDRVRRRARFDAALGELAMRLDDTVPDVAALDEESIADDRLRLIFTCCHPRLPPDAQVAMTLRELCGLTTEEIARAWLTTPPTIAQRIVRAKARIRDEHIPYAVPEVSELPGRLDAVLRVVYLVYTEGYEATSGASLTRVDLSSEAIRLGTLLLELVPHPEVQGLLALMLLTESRRATRTDEQGDLVLLADQDRSRWDRGLIDQGLRLATQARSAPEVGSYALQAAIAAEHACAATAAETDWARIVAWYDLLRQAEPSPVIDLNRAVAVAMRDGPEAGLMLVDELARRPDLTRHHLAHSARADLLRRLGRNDDAATAYRRAIELVQQAPERRYLERRLAEVTRGSQT
jgi:RNA polymerase sigma-70 factor (ECF subfamily)